MWTVTRSRWRKERASVPSGQCLQVRLLSGRRQCLFAIRTSPWQRQFVAGAGARRARVCDRKRRRYSLGQARLVPPLGRDIRTPMARHPWDFAGSAQSARQSLPDRMGCKPWGLTHAQRVQIRQNEFAAVEDKRPLQRTARFDRSRPQSRI